MHQTQYAKVRAASLDEALARFGAHVQALGGIDNWWRLEAAWIPGSGEIVVPVPQPQPGEEEAPSAEELAKRHAALAADLRARLSTEEPWIRAAWDAGSGAWGAIGADWDEDGEPLGTGPVFELPLADLPRWFLEEARALLVRRYSELLLDGPFRRGTAEIPGIVAASLRVGLARALEEVLAALDDPRLAPDLPFLPDLGPYDWPAHRIGEGEHTFFLLIDMHR